TRRNPARRNCIPTCWWDRTDMAIELKMPALSPTMEEGTLAKWLVKEGDTGAAGDRLAEIETDKPTTARASIDEGTVGKIRIPEGSEGVKVGTVIAVVAGEGEDASSVSAPTAAAPAPEQAATEAKGASVTQTGEKAGPGQSTAEVTKPK